MTAEDISVLEQLYSRRRETTTVKEEKPDVPLTEYMLSDGKWTYLYGYEDSQFRIYLKTTEEVPASIEEFRAPTVHPEGLIKKVLYENEEMHWIIYCESEEDSYWDSIYKFMQYCIPVEEEPISKGGSGDYITTEVNGYEALYSWNSLSWHDDKYRYTLSCAEENTTIEDLIKIAESVK